MKKRFLPISLLLVIMILGQSVMADQGGHYVPRVKGTATAESELSIMRVNQHTGMIDPAWMIEASRQSTLMNSKEDDGKEVYWLSMGPTNMGGRTTSVLFNNQNQNEIYIGSMGGGVFYSWNKGITWHQVGEDLMVSCMVQAEDGTIYVGTGDGMNAVSYNGLEDVSYENSFIGTGVYMIRNNQMSQVMSTAPANQNEAGDWSFVNDIAIDGNTLVAATATGLRYITTDRVGDPLATWEYAQTTEGENIVGNVQEVKVMSGHKFIASVDGDLYIGALSAMGIRTASATHLNENNAIDTLRVAGAYMDIAVAPSDMNVLYAAAIGTSGNHEAIYLSEDQGATWRKILSKIEPTLGHQLYEDRGLFNHGLTVAPNNPYCVYVTAYNLWRLDKAVTDPMGYFLAVKLSEGNSGNIFTSDCLHSGVNAIAFNPRNDKVAYIGTDGGIFRAQADASLYLSYTNCNRGYVSTRCFNVAPTGYLCSVVAGLMDHGPVYIADVEGSADKPMYPAVPLYPSNSVATNGNFDDTYHAGPCAVSTINPEIFFLVTRDGAIKRTETAGVDYDADNFNANQSFSYTGYRMPIALWESYNDLNSRDSVWFKCKENYAAGDQILCRSGNGSYPFFYTLTAPLYYNDSVPQMSDSIYVQDPVVSKFFVADGSALYYTREALKFNKATTWYKLTTLPDAASCITVSADGDMVFVGTRNGKLVRVTNLLEAVDDSTSLSSSSMFAPEIATIDLSVDGQYVTSVSISNDNNGVVVTLGNYGNDNYVLYSNNALAETPEFVAKQGNGLPKMPVYSSVIDMTTGDVLIGTEHGVYRTTSIEGAPTWVSEGANMGDVPVMEMKQQTIFQETQYVPTVVDTMTVMVPYDGVYNQGVIYAATYGKGLFRCESYRLYSGQNVPEMPVAAKASVEMYPNPVRDAAKISFELNQATAVSYQVFDMMGRMVGMENLGNLSEGTHEINVTLNGLSSGAYILRLNAGQNSSSVKFMMY